MRTLWWRRALQQRLGSLAAAALVLWTVGTAIAASIATNGIADALIAEREIHAGTIAALIDRALEDDFRHLDRVAAAAAIASPSLESQVRALRLAESVVRIAPDGTVLWTRSVVDGRESTPVITQLPTRLASRHLDATGEIHTDRGTRVFLIVPARESDAIGGAVGAALDLKTSPIATVLNTYAGEPYRVDLLDAEGRMIANSRQAPALSDDVHELEPGDFVARASISNGGWRVRLIQSRADALAPVFALRRVLVGSSLFLVPFAVLVAWATARSIRQPVLAITFAAERLARGEFAEPVPPAGEDEIGRLAEALEQLRKALEADDRRSRLLKHVIAAQEEERRRIARELHDQTTQQLTALGMQLGSASVADAQTRDVLARSSALVAATIDDVHRLIYDLRPSVLDDLGLLPAIRTHAEKHLAGHGVQVNCEFPASMPAIPPEATTALYRVAQEALSNVARHARAAAVLIGCTVTAIEIVVEIEDDGVGFEPEHLTHPRETGEGLGLLGMRERLALLGGRLHVESEPGRGTRVVAALPFAAAGKDQRQ